ncbi:MAG: HEAT repeat domain-containing protein, partial [Gemmataceae bacterium]|nr:HEAT repeat domain-containing protein [Gemmataceae bacterium]
MRVPIIACCGLLLATVCGAAGLEKRFYFAGTPAPMPLVADGPGDAGTEKLIKDLGADDWRTRENAGRELAAQGEKALPFLRRALRETDSPEVQRRLAVLVQKLDRERLVSPKKVTLTAKNRTAQQVIEEISKQTGYRIEFQGQSDAKHSFE